VCGVCHNAEDLLTGQFPSTTRAPSACDTRATERRLLLAAPLSSTQQAIEGRTPRCPSIALLRIRYHGIRRADRHRLQGAKDAHGPPIRPAEAQDHVDRGRRARAVGAEQSRDLAKSTRGAR